MQRLKLDINPKGEIPVLHVAQYDKGRLFEAELVEGEQAYNVPSGYSVQLNVRKTDSKLVTKAPDSIIDNILTFSTTEQMTACAGENIGSITLKDADAIVVTTLYFLISVQRDVLAGGLDSASEIHDLEQQIASIVPEVIGDDYYNKTETDALLENKANISDIPDMSNYYTKAQTYSSSQIDTALSYKADRSELTDYALKDWVELNFVDAAYLSTHYYNKNAVDNLLFNMLPIGKASGNPCTFDTEIAAELQALTANIVCGGGGGTPSAPIALVPHSALNLDVNGNTFTVAFGQTVYGGVYDKSGRLTITHGVIDLGTLDYSLIPNGNGAYFYGGLGANPLSVANANCLCSIYESTTAWYIMNTAIDNAVGVEDTYLTIRNSAYNDASAFKTAMSGVMLAYELATPIVIDVPSISAFAENGTNNIVSDCGGDVNVSYKDTIQHYIDTRS